MLEKNPTTVKIVFKNYPLRSHPYASSAAVAALAADRQGKFWEFHDELFKIYSRLSNQAILEIAQKLGLNLSQFQEDRNAAAIQAIIQSDIQEAVRIGVRGIPSVYLNGKKMRTTGLHEFQAAIDKEKKRTSAGGSESSATPLE